ncbi:hypothetical protein EN784_03925 [bacterium M00.F.Ca.ET.141.01.1.1]|nr:hypothetical protein EN784_03925 [bacterium M00.F.Ca.ET.141.01.1.1]
MKAPILEIQHDPEPTHVLYGVGAEYVAPSDGALTLRAVDNDVSIRWAQLRGATSLRMQGGETCPITVVKGDVIEIV